MPPDPSMDRLGDDGASDSLLLRWAQGYGLSDVWRWRYPRERQYTCHSATYASFSRIYLFYASGPILSRVQEVKILPRGISDHAPSFCNLTWTRRRALAYGEFRVFG